MNEPELTAETTGKAAPQLLPQALRARANGQLDGQTILAWAEFDLDENNKYHQQFAVLTDQNLIVLDGAVPRVIEIGSIKEAKIIEGLGVDRLQIIVGEKLAEVFWGPASGGAIEDWFAYVLALVVLLIRPQGLFGERIIERV